MGGLWPPVAPVPSEDRRTAGGNRGAAWYPPGAGVIDPALDVLRNETQRPLLPTDPNRRDAPRLGRVV